MTFDELLKLGWDQALPILKEDDFDCRKPVQYNIDYYNNCHTICKDQDCQDD